MYLNVAEDNVDPEFATDLHIEDRLEKNEHFNNSILSIMVI